MICPSAVICPFLAASRRSCRSRTGRTASSIAWRAPDSWFEDFGIGHLTGGRARIELDPDFATTVNTDGYHVFITEYDDHNGLFVTNRTNTGFEVRAKTSASEAAFSYRVVAKRKDIAPARFAKTTLPTRGLEEIKASLAKAG